MKLYNANDIDLILKMEVTRHIEQLPVASLYQGWSLWLVPII